MVRDKVRSPTRLGLPNTAQLREAKKKVRPVRGLPVRVVCPDQENNVVKSRCVKDAVN